MQDRLVTLRQLEKGVAASRAEVAKSAQSKELIDRTLLGLRWTKAVCDAFIDIASEFVPNPATGKLLKSGYKITSTTAEAVSSAAAGQKIDYVKTTTTIVTSAMSGAEKLSKVPAGAKEQLAMLNKTAGLFKVKTDIVHSALKQDEKGVTKGVFVDLSAEIGSLVLSELKAETAGKVLKIGKSFADTGISMRKAYDEFKSERDVSASTFRSTKRTMERSLESLRSRIGLLERQLSACEAELAAKEPVRLP